MNMGDTPHAISDEAIKPLKEYCKNRNYKCRGCRYSLEYITKEKNKYVTCIFANCPCSWDTSEVEHRRGEKI